jgi:hypothetical protein
MSPTSDQDVLVRIRRSLTVVGPNKAIGYLPLYTIIDILGADPEDLIAEAHVQGLSTIVLGPEQCCIKSGALYVYDSATLEQLLKTSADLVQTNALSIEPELFVKQIAATWFESTEPVYSVIKAAFGELQ